MNYQIFVLDENDERLDPQPESINRGDRVEVIRANGVIEKKQYNPDEFAEPEQPAINTAVTVPTIDWLRDHFTTESERKAKMYVAERHTYANQVGVFMDMVKDRMSVNLRISDEDYADGIVLVYSVGIVEGEHAQELLELGGHNPSLIQ